MCVMTRHPSEARLLDLADERLAPEERERTATHVAGCLRCRTELDALRRLLETMRTDRSEDAPPAAVAAAIRLFRPRIEEERPSTLQRLIAVLRFDSRQQPLALGMRAGQAAGRHLLYSAGEHDLDIRLTQRAGLWTAAGQVLGPAGAGEVELEGATAVVRGAITELGEFTLPPVPPGTYTLRLRLAAVELEAADLEIGDT
jgi:anti-sigma factor RsiW